MIRHLNGSVLEARHPTSRPTPHRLAGHALAVELEARERTVLAARWLGDQPLTGGRSAPIRNTLRIPRRPPTGGSRAPRTHHVRDAQEYERTTGRQNAWPDQRSGGTASGQRLVVSFSEVFARAQLLMGFAAKTSEGVDRLSRRCAPCLDQGVPKRSLVPGWETSEVGRVGDEIAIGRSRAV